jgi:hypothetical protein
MDSFPSPYPSYGPPPLPPNFSLSYDEHDPRYATYPYPGEDPKHVTPPGASKKGRSKSATPIASNTSSKNMVLPEAAEEVDFVVTDPPMEPVTPESTEPVCESLADVNSYDVLCGRGGGTNSQIGNRRFRQLVQDFQPTYFMAKRKEKPLLARTIVLIIRKRGGRFLKKNEDTGALYEVGDTKAEAKTSQALREGLDVRATKSAQNLAMGKVPKKKKPKSSPDGSPKKGNSKKSTPDRAPRSPPTLPRLAGEEVKAGGIHPHSPDQAQFRKRRRMRSTERFFSDFMPPRADISQGGHDGDDGVLEDVNTTPIRRNDASRDEVDYADCGTAQGCAGIALDIVTGAATGSFCLGPSGWRR